MENKKCNDNCNTKKCSSIYNDSCFKLGSLTDILRSPRVFYPKQAIANLQILACGFTGVKAAVLNYLYQVSELYDRINNTNDAIT